MKILESVPQTICNQNDINYCLYIDTDSNYFHALPLLKHINPNFDNLSEDEKDDMLELVANKYQSIVNEYYNEFAVEYFNSNNHFLEIKTECTIKSSYFRKVRRYAQYISRKEGIKKDTLDIKGMEFKMVNFPKFIGNFFKDIINSILYDYTESQINDKVLELKEGVTSISTNIFDIAIPTSVKTMDNYLVNKPCNGKIFSEIKKGANAPIKAAHAYNDLLNYYKLNKKHSYITCTDKVKWVYLLPNEFNLDAIAFIDYDMPSILFDFINKYSDRNKIYNNFVKKKIAGIYDDLGWSLNINPFSNKFFKFK